MKTMVMKKIFFYNHHPNIAIFVNKLLEFQVDSYIKIQRIQLNRYLPSHMLKSKNFVEKLLSDLNLGNKSRIEFVKAISYRYRVNNK